jgi:hypothetical protein
MNEKSRNNVYFKRKRDFKAAIEQFFAVTLPEVAKTIMVKPFIHTRNRIYPSNLKMLVSARIKWLSGKTPI